MKIGMILDKEFPPDPRVENEAKILVDNGFDLSIMSFNYGNKSKFENYLGIKIYRYPIKKMIKKKGTALVNTILDFYTILITRYIIDFITKNKIDVLHVHDLHILGAAIEARKKQDFILIGDLHENYADAIKYYKFSTTFPGNILISPKKWKRKEKEWISKCDYVVTVVDEMKERVSAFIEKDKIIVYGNYPNLRKFLDFKKDEKLYKKYKDNFVISYIGGFDYHRGIDILIEAMSYIKDTIDLKLILVGSGKNLNELRTKIKKLGIDSTIDFIGWISPDILPNYFKISNIGIIPHLKSVQTDNSSPNKLFQYMAVSVPVISTNCNSLKRIVNESKCGLVYDYNNARKLADKIIKLYRNERLRKEMGDNGRKAVIEKYNWENTSKNLIELYKKIEKDNG